MKKRKVELVVPESQLERESNSSVKSFSSTIVHEEEGDVYSTVEKFRGEIFPGIDNEDMEKRPVREKSLLVGIITLHNAAEIEERSTSVEEMLEKIDSGRHVLMPDGLPNVKVAKTRTEDLVCFDGHHTLLAYMMAGREYLDEVPHLMITDDSGEGLEDEEIHEFFGEHANKLNSSGWRNYTISWTNPLEEQLEERKQENMGELLEALTNDDFEFKLHR